MIKLTWVMLGAVVVVVAWLIGGVDLAGVVFLVLVVGTMGVGSWELRRDRRAGKRSTGPQLVAQPVATASPPSVQPVVTINHYRRPSSPPVAMMATTGPQPADEDLQPPAQPAATGGGLIGALGVMGAAEWYQSMGRDAPVVASSQSVGFDGDDLPTWADMVAAAGALNGGGVDLAPAEAAVSAGDRPLLARVPPTMADYPLINEVLQGSVSQNAAIRTLWGSKDGKVLGWLARVRDLYAECPRPTRADIIGWELETGDDVVDVAERLGVSVEEVQAVFDGE